MPNDRVLGKLKNADQKMLLQLEEARATFRQKGNRGDEVEAALRAFLRDYTRLLVGTGEVIDLDGNSSTQTDIVIVGENHPLTFNRDSAGLFFIEGVKAAGEAKSVLDRTQLRGTPKEKGILDKSRLFKTLTVAHSMPGSNRAYRLGQSPSNLYEIHRPWFLIALESRLSLEAIYREILQYQRQHNLGNNEMVDAVFVVGEGWVVNYAGLWPLPSHTVAMEEQWQWEWPWKWKQSDMVLCDMLAWLSVVMPRDMREGPFMYWYTEPF